MNKYNAKPIVIDGIRFDSTGEGRRYSELKLLLKAGIISKLELQPVYLLQEAFTHKGKKHRVINYKADFRYIENGEIITEDFKGFKTNTYKLKKKLLLCKYPNITLIETG